MVDYPPPGAPRRRFLKPSHRLLLGLAAAGSAAAAVAPAVPWQATPLVGWDAGALIWMGAVWIEVLGFDAVGTSLHATNENPGRALADGLLLAASAVSLLAVAIVTAKAGRAHGEERGALLAVSIISVFSSWGLVHTLFTLRYAALYYTGPDGGVDFNQAAKPTYLDFAYLAFTIGMTFQVSDTAITDPAIRRTALRHALLSYLFGAVILAVVINLVAGLVR